MISLRRLLAAAALSSLALAACSGARAPGVRGSGGDLAPGADRPYLDERAALLLLVDRQLYEPVIVRRAIAGPAPLRAELARAVGRIGDPRGIGVLSDLLADEDLEVRREAAFAMGEIGEELAAVAGVVREGGSEPSPEAESARRRLAARLLVAVVDPDRETGRLAIEGLGKSEVVLAQVAGALVDLPEGERGARLLPSLYRFREPGRIPVAGEALGDPDPELHAWAAYALLRDPLPEALGYARALVEDRSPRVRAWAARALGRVGEGEDLRWLQPLLDEEDPGPLVQALGAGRALVAGGEAAPEASWRPRLAELLVHPLPGVRMAVLDASAAWLPDGGLARELAARAVAGPPAEAAAALLALAGGGDPRAAELAAEASSSPEPALRAAAAEAAAVLGAPEILARLAEDPEARVRQAVLAARLAGAGGVEPGAAARAALADLDPGVRATALDWLGEHPVLPLAALEPALARALASPVLEEGLAAIDALAARAGALAARAGALAAGAGAPAAGAGALAAQAGAEPRERGALVGLLGEVAAGATQALRRRAADALAGLGLPRPAVGPIDTGKSLAIYRDMIVQTAAERTVEIRLAPPAGGAPGAGAPARVLRLRLACPLAPLTCLSFLQLARQGYYDGTPLHRVVPDFVVQGGDPRGDGWGGPGYALRDEVNRLRYGRGVLGMAHAGPDTAGSQFFITLAPQPHLDGGYTVFGEVVEGEELLDGIARGDLVVAIREVE